MAGYSGKPLVTKLGIKPFFNIFIINAPPDYKSIVHDIPESVIILTAWKKNINLVHIFSIDKSEMIKSINKAKNHITQNGMIWVSWPKKSSKLLTDITEDTIRNIALSIDLVDIKVCAIDDCWSGLKLVIRKEKRIL